MKIVNFGSCNIDYVYQVPHFVRPGETLSSTDLNRFPGGKGLNQSIAMARSGCKVYHAGCIGQDGLFLKELLAEAGADVSYLKVTDSPSGQAIIQVDDNGENSIILYSGSNAKITKEYIDEVLLNFEKGDIVVLQNEISNVDYIVEKAYDLGLTIVLNPAPFHEDLKKIDLNKISVLILNEVEAEEFSGESQIEKIKEFFKGKNIKTVLTLGSKGCLYFDKDTELYCPAFCVDVIDTTSAGDTFTGYFVSGLVKNLDIESNLRYASAASALAVSKLGAAVSIPISSEVENALKTLKSLSCDDTNKKRSFILGSDWWDDCDDVAALRILARKHKAGEIELKGVILDACMDISCASVSAFLQSEGLKGMPIGIDKEATDYKYYSANYHVNLAKNPHYAENADCMDGVKLYRKLLSETEGKTEIAEIGFSQVLTGLLESEPDEFSPLCGFELVKQKVEKLWIMAGSWEKGKENNFARNIRSRRAAGILCRKWPTPITFLGYEVGESVIHGTSLSDETDLLRKAMIDHGSSDGRSSWDPMLCLMACIGDEKKAGYTIVRGTASVNMKTGENSFVKDENGNHCYVIKDYPDEYYSKQIDEIIK